MDRKAGLLLLCALALAATAQAGSRVIPWQDADGYVGEEVTVEGTVVAARREGNVLRLTFDPNPQAFSVALVATLFSPLPAAPATLYEGHTIRATGKIRSFRGVSEMAIRDHSQLVIVAAEPSPTPRVSIEDRLNHLEERVERLERRLQK